MNNFDFVEFFDFLKFVENEVLMGNIELGKNNLVHVVDLRFLILLNSEYDDSLLD